MLGDPDLTPMTLFRHVRTAHNPKSARASGAAPPAQG